VAGILKGTFEKHVWIIYCLKAVSWTIKDFSIKKSKDKLRELHLQINKDGCYDTPQHRFIVVAQKVKG
jgi:hypothetical protein